MSRKLVMDDRPVIDDRNILLPHYARYRAMLCGEDVDLDQRLRAGRGEFQKDFFELTERFEAVLLDAFGVLNMGRCVLPGAVETLARLRHVGKPFRIVSNNASQSPEGLLDRFQEMGFDIQQEEIITSGMMVHPYVQTSEIFSDRPYYLVGTGESREAYAPHSERWMVNDPASDLEIMDATYLILCSNRDYYNGPQQQQVEQLLETHDAPFPILLANPDLAAPNENGGIDAVAGWTAVEWIERFHCSIAGLGKPFSLIFQQALASLPNFIQPNRVLMVGDTLDTDILGGVAMGMSTCLVLSGAYAKVSSPPVVLCCRRGVYPDFVVSSIGSRAH